VELGRVIASGDPDHRVRPDRRCSHQSPNQQLKSRGGGELDMSPL